MDSNTHLSDYLNLSSKTSTFVSIDVVGSTSLKTGQNEQDIIYTFLAYHKLVSDLAYSQHGEIFNIMGDGIICRFIRPEDALSLVHALLVDLSPFNKKQNRLTQPLRVRVGVHTGEVYESQGLSSGQVVSKTIDTTAKLQESAETGHARFSEATLSLLTDKRALFRRVGWDAALGTTVYDYAPGGTAETAATRKLPDRARILIVEPELEEIMKLKKTLFSRRHDAFTVYTQNQAALAIGAWAPHAILLSVDLTWDTGWELLTSLRGDAKMSAVPIIAMSRQTTGETIQRSFRMGANGFLRKPLDEQQIAKRVEMVLREFY